MNSTSDKKDEYLALLNEFETLILDANDDQLPRRAQLPVSKRLNEVRAKLQVSFAPSATRPKLPSLPDEIQEWCWHMDTALEQDSRHAAMALQAAWPHVSKWLRANVAPSSVAGSPYVGRSSAE